MLKQTSMRRIVQIESIEAELIFNNPGNNAKHVSTIRINIVLKNNNIMLIIFMLNILNFSMKTYIEQNKLIKDNKGNKIGIIAFALLASI